MEISGHQLKTETISPCGFEKVLSNTSVKYFDDRICVRLPRRCEQLALTVVGDAGVQRLGDG
jgi:hypothetical protein